MEIVILKGRASIACETSFRSSGGTTIYTSAKVSIHHSLKGCVEVPIEFTWNDPYYVQDVKYVQLLSFIVNKEMIDEFTEDDVKGLVGGIYMLCGIHMEVPPRATNHLLKSEMMVKAMNDFFRVKKLEYLWLLELTSSYCDQKKCDFKYRGFYRAQQRFVEDYGTLFSLFDKMFRCGFGSHYLHDESGKKYFARFIELLPLKFDARASTFDHMCFADVSSTIADIENIED